MARLLRVALLIGAALTLALPAGRVSASEALECPEGTFKCYCNGDFVGCVTSIAYCWNACVATVSGDPLADRILGSVHSDASSIHAEVRVEKSDSTR